MPKIGFLFHLVWILLTWNEVQSQVPAKWVFIGVTIEEDLGCTNKVYSRHEGIWLRPSESAKENRQEVVATLKAKYAPHHILVKTVVVDGKKSQYIGLVEKSRKCSGKGAQAPVVSSYSFYSGYSEESIRRQAETDKKLYPEIITYKIISIVNSEDIVQPVKVAATQTANVENYDGLVVKTTAMSKKNGDKIYQVKLTNSRQLVSAIVEITPAGKPTEKHFVDPSQVLTLYYDRSVSVRMAFVPTSKKSGNMTENVVNWIKYEIRLQQGEVKQEREQIDTGVRG